MRIIAKRCCEIPKATTFFGVVLTGGVLATILFECRGDGMVTAYVGGRLIDGNGGTPLEDTTIITRGGRFL